jgi:2-oxo-4-hydroxy-4-carboxy-5-ureidoimidazoline decarboxylase
MDVDAVNRLGRAEFAAAFGHVLEDSPELAARVWEERPFADATAIAAAFVRAVEALDDDAALTLLCAHPELGARGPMAAASVSEQSSAGIDRAGVDVLTRLEVDNGTYRERFGFPFILAVRGRTVEEIASNLEARLTHPVAVERAEALRQVGQIAALRIDQLVDG